ncbi:MAG: hypothetical protein ACP5VQ_11350, partial [Phycisphaerae bacterium]
MATYSYKALNASGQTIKGEVEASSSDDAISKLRAQGNFLTEPPREKGVKKVKAKAGGGTATAVATATAAKAAEEMAAFAPKKKKKKSLNEISFSVGKVSRKHLT